jgi:hypothetical protein
MECGLSSTPTTQGRDRPTDLRSHYDTREATGRQRQLTGFKQDSYCDPMIQAEANTGTNTFQLHPGKHRKTV